MLRRVVRVPVAASAERLTRSSRLPRLCTATTRRRRRRRRRRDQPPRGPTRRRAAHLLCTDDALNRLADDTVGVVEVTDTGVVEVDAGDADDDDDEVASAAAVATVSTAVSPFRRSLSRTV